MCNLKCISQWILTMRKCIETALSIAYYTIIFQKVVDIHHLNVNPVHISNHYTTRLMRIMNYFSSHSPSNTYSNLWKSYNTIMLIDTWESFLCSYSWTEFFSFLCFPVFDLYNCLWDSKPHSKCIYPTPAAMFLCSWGTSDLLEQIPEHHPLTHTGIPYCFHHFTLNET